MLYQKQGKMIYQKHEGAPEWEVEIVGYDLDKNKVILLTSDDEEILIDEYGLKGYEDKIEEVRVRAQINRQLSPLPVGTRTRILRTLLHAQY